MAYELGGIMSHGKKTQNNECIALAKSLTLDQLGLSQTITEKLSAQTENVWTLALLFTSELFGLGLSRREVKQFDRALSEHRIARMPRKVLDGSIKLKKVRHLQAA